MVLGSSVMGLSQYKYYIISSGGEVSAIFSNRERVVNVERVRSPFLPHISRDEGRNGRTNEGMNEQQTKKPTSGQTDGRRKMMTEK